MSKNTWGIAFAVAVALTVVGVSQGATIIVNSPAPGGGLAEVVWSSSEVSGHIEIELSKDFRSAEMVSDYASIILQVTLEASDLGKEIWLVHSGLGEQVDNNTGVAWNKYYLSLWNYSSYQSEYCGASLVDPASISSTAFATATISGDPNVRQVAFTDGTLPSGSSQWISGVKIATSATYANAGDIFYIRQKAVPEPASALLLAVGAAAAVLRRRAKK